MVFTKSIGSQDLSLGLTPLLISPSGAFGIYMGVSSSDSEAERDSPRESNRDFFPPLMSVCLSSIGVVVLLPRFAVLEVVLSAGLFDSKDDSGFLYCDCSSGDT